MDQETRGDAASKNVDSHPSAPERTGPTAADLARLSALAERLLAPSLGAEREAFLEALASTLTQTPRDEALAEGDEAFLRAFASLWRFGAARPAGTHLLRVYAPSAARDGWSGPHAVMEAVNDDMPFLVDSLTGLLTDRGLRIHGLIHPILWTSRDESGARLPSADVGSALRESWIQIQFDAVGDEAAMAALQAEADRIMADVRAVVRDWKPMTTRLSAASEELRAHAPAPLKDVAGEAAEFLEWLGQDHFTFLGWRDYRFEADAEGRRHAVAEAGLGLMRDPGFTILRDAEGAEADWSPELDAFASDDEPLLVLKANRRSTVHRVTHFDFIGVKRFDAEGRVIGETGIIGLFTSSAYHASPMSIPLLRGKTRRIIARSGFTPASHDGKALVGVLARHPRDELLQASEDQLFEQAIGALQLGVRPRPRLFVRQDRFGRFYSCLVYVPRDAYDTAQREMIGDILCAALNGRVASFTPSFDDRLIRVHFVIAALPGTAPDYDPAEIETRIVEAVRDWSDALRQILIDRHGEAEGARLHRAYDAGFEPAYRQTATPEFAAADIVKFEQLSAERGVATGFFRLDGDAGASLRFKLYRYGELAPLSDVIPILENMGLRILEEHPYRAERRGADGMEILYLHDFMLTTKQGDIDPEALAARRPALEDGFVAVWRGECGDDPLNRLMLSPGLCPRRTALLRAYSRFLRQARIPYSVSYMEDALAENPGVAEALTRLFAALFDPSDARDPDARLASAQQIQDEIETALEQVSSLDVDQILRRFRNAVTATLRTNYYQTDADGRLKPYFSFKFDSSALEDLPAPRPWREIFVYAPWVEGAHLRGGPVARGGLRWSDRREDFRTEVLGLVKAQQVKNAVIVPVGSKGGFLPKKLPIGGDREAIQAEAIRSYKTFLSGMLDLTDNLVEGAPVPPAAVVRRDEDDPYLVVAADKGTATFSDIANGVAQDYGFWLGDAFASGGSQGYDHKGMGITARGAWEAVKRHFRELGRDTQTEPFTVTGVGDMSGDVFGNGMLLSDQIRLRAAFDHRDIFIDPDPDAARSFKERQRLFALGRSSWKDYDAALISRGGGVFSRSAKSIALSDEIRALIGSHAPRLTPMDLIKALLKAPTDLLWFGGIGTYVKDVDESHAEVGDRANEGVRIDAEALGARVVGEGANLAVTQRARVALSHRGVKINTDAVDNAAGVDCSDHEVNIKIALGAAVEAGALTLEARNALLAEMTDEVARLVLVSNYDQTAAISLTEARAAILLDEHAGFIREAEEAGRLDRAVEFLPDDAAIAARRKAHEGLTRPEIAVLTAYAKIGLFQDLVEADLLEDPSLERWLIDYFPVQMRERFRDQILGHRLRREIIATQLANAMINEGGLTMAMRLGQESGATPPEVARAYLAAWELFDLNRIRGEIDALDNKVSAETQVAMRLTLQDALAAQCLNLLQRGESETVAATLERVGPGVREVCDHLGETLSDYSRRRMADTEKSFIENGAPEPLAARVAALTYQGGAVAVVDAAQRLGRSVAETAATYYAVGARFELDWLRFAAMDLRPDDDWERVAIDRLTSDLRAQQSAVAAAALRACEGLSGAECVAEWAAAYPKIVDRADRILSQMREAEDLTVAKLAVATSLLSGWG